jgi:hypothetical protein
LAAGGDVPDRYTDIFPSIQPMAIVAVGFFLVPFLTWQTSAQCQAQPGFGHRFVNSSLPLGGVVDGA